MDERSAKTSNSAESCKAGPNAQSRGSESGSTAAHSNASSDPDFERGFDDTTACYLKTRTNKFRKFQLALEDGQLNFYKIAASVAEGRGRRGEARGSHKLDNVHVMYGAVEKCKKT